METDCLINGEPGHTISVADRGLHYGDGLFETLAVRDGACALWDLHMARLQRGCEALGIAAPPLAELKQDATQLVAAAERAVLKIIVTRGAGGRGYAPPIGVRPTRIVMRSDWPDYPAGRSADGVEVRLCQHTLSGNPRLAGIKHLNRLDQVLARAEWSDATIAEGLMCDATGAIIEGTFTNVFVVREGRLRTPALTTCGVAGVMREAVLSAADRLGIECEVSRIEPRNLLEAEELFLTNSLIGIWPVRKFEQWQREPGSLTRRLQAALGEILPSLRSETR